MGNGGIDHDYRSKRDYGYTAQRIYAVAVPSPNVRLLIGLLLSILVHIAVESSEASAVPARASCQWSLTNQFRVLGLVCEVEANMFITHGASSSHALPVPYFHSTSGSSCPR